MPGEKTFPGKPVLVLVGIVAAIRLSFRLRTPPEVLQPSFLASALFLYAPMPRYLRRGVPSWLLVPDAGRSARILLLLTAAGAAVLLLLARLPLPPEISPFHGTVPALSWPLAAHLLFLVAIPEEVFFRGYLFDAFEETGWEPILPTSLLFAAAHVAIAPSPFRALTFFPALLLGWGRRASGNLFVPAAVHFLYDLYPWLIGGAS